MVPGGSHRSLGQWTKIGPRKAADLGRKTVLSPLATARSEPASAERQADREHRRAAFLRVAKSGPSPCARRPTRAPSGSSRPPTSSWPSKSSTAGRRRASAGSGAAGRFSICDLASFPWDLADADLDPLAGACTARPHRASQHPEMPRDRSPAPVSMGGTGAGGRPTSALGQGRRPRCDNWRLRCVPCWPPRARHCPAASARCLFVPG